MKYCEPLLKIVDLGRAGKWANINLGAYDLLEIGDFYAYGEIEPKGEYEPHNYMGVEQRKILNFPSITRYDYTGRRQELLLSSDAAHELWGGKWRIPSFDDFKSLLFWCKRTSETIDGTFVSVFTSKDNGNSIILPITEYRYDKIGNKIIGKKTHAYWSRTYGLYSSSNSKDHAWCLTGYMTQVNFSLCYAGYAVRPIWDENL